MTGRERQPMLETVRHAKEVVWQCCLLLLTNFGGAGVNTFRRHRADADADARLVRFASGRVLPVVTVCGFSTSATCYAASIGRVRPGADRHFWRFHMCLPFRYGK
jgi:hypothetical protein